MMLSEQDEDRVNQRQRAIGITVMGGEHHMHHWGKPTLRCLPAFLASSVGARGIQGDDPVSRAIFVKVTCGMTEPRGKQQAISLRRLTDMSEFSVSVFHLEPNARHLGQHFSC